LKFSEEELISKKYSVLSLDLIKKLLTLDPEQRLSAAEALKHPWIIQFTDLIKSDAKN
jgi:serine/threonine protein kinase